MPSRTYRNKIIPVRDAELSGLLVAPRGIFLRGVSLGRVLLAYFADTSPLTSSYLLSFSLFFLERWKRARVNIHDFKGALKSSKCYLSIR